MRSLILVVDDESDVEMLLLTKPIDFVALRIEIDSRIAIAG